MPFVVAWRIAVNKFSGIMELGYMLYRGTSKERLLELFSEHGTVVGFKFFQ